MPWPVIYRAERPKKPKVGDCWPAPDWEDSCSPRYMKEHKGKRPPLMVALPSTSGSDDWVNVFLLDRFDGDNPKSEGWTVVIKGELVDGQKINMEVSPSINCVGSYHGHIKAGMVTDDCEGRKYEGKKY